MRPLLVACLASAFAFAAAPAAAASPDEPTASADSGQRLAKEFYENLFAKHFDKALAATNDLHPDSSNKEGVALVDSMRAAAFLGLKKDAEAQRLIAEIEKLQPQDPAAASTLFAGGLLTDRFDVAADAFDELIARFPDAARDEDSDLVSYFLNNEPKNQERRNEDRKIALARIGYGGDTEGGHWRVYRAVDILVKRGDASGAGDLLQYVKELQPIEDMLIQKRYSALWPKLQNLAGSHLTNVRTASVASAERAYEAAPDDHEKLQNYVNALRHAGRLQEAIALKAKLPATPAAMAEADEQLGWVVNNVGLALYDAGRSDEADQLFGLLNEATINDGGGWRVSMIINRLELLVTSGKFDKAATLLEATEASARTHGNPYAQQLVRRLKYCTLSSLGKKEEAAKVLPDVLAHAKEAYGPTIDGLLCAGQVDQAEKIALEALGGDNKEKFEEDFVRELQPVLLTSDDPSVWQGRWTELRKRPAIAAAYARLGRDMPADLLPEKPKAVPAK